MISVEHFQLALKNFYLVLKNFYLALNCLRLALKNFQLALENFQLALIGFLSALTHHFLALSEVYETLIETYVAFGKEKKDQGQGRKALNACWSEIACLFGKEERVNGGKTAFKPPIFQGERSKKHKINSIKRFNIANIRGQREN